MNTSNKKQRTLLLKKEISLDGLPGHLFRRLHQLAVADFTARMGDLGLTPIQWSSLVSVKQNPGLDQITLSRAIFIDTSTLAGVLDRLESRGLVRREASPDDKRVRLLYITEEGIDLLQHANEVVYETQEWLMEPLSPSSRATFMKLMLRVLNRND